MKAFAKIAVFALALIPAASAVAQRGMVARPRMNVVHSRAPRVRVKTVSVRPGR